MKVICIDATNPKRPHLLLPEDYIVEGEVYTVIGEYYDKSDEHTYYYLKEKVRKPLPGYKAIRFIPITGKEEKMNNEKLELMKMV